MRILAMEKEKPKGSPRRPWIIIRRIIVVFALIATLLCGAWTYYDFYPGHSLSYFSRFETSEEVVAFLHDNFDLQVTTSEEILTFMDAYPLKYDGCRDGVPGSGNFAGYVVDENVTNIITCWIPSYIAFPGERYYRVQFYITADNLLEYIGATKHCACW